MDSYFSRLIHQTGIQIGEVTDRKATGLAQYSQPLESTSETPQLETVVHKQVTPETEGEPYREERIFQTPASSHRSNLINTKQPIFKGATRTDAQTESSLERYMSREEIVESDFSEPKINSPQFDASDEIYKGTSPAYTNEVIPSQSKSQSDQDETTNSSRSSLEINPQRITAISESPIRAKEAGHLPGPNNVSRERKNPESIQSQPSLETAVTQLREWVSETPAPDENAFSQAAQEKNLPAAPLPIHTREMQDRKEPEIEDFQISIGSIHLTIEEPPEQQQKLTPYRDNKAPQIPRDVSYSLLNRHYIKFY
jgi:hypothetical protein